MFVFFSLRTLEKILCKDKPDPVKTEIWDAVRQEIDVGARSKRAKWEGN